MNKIEKYTYYQEIKLEKNEINFYFYSIKLDN